MIYRETHTSNYTVYPNTLINAKLPSDAKNVLTWLLSKPKNWKLIKVVIAEALGLSKHRVQQAVTILKNLGYLCFFRHKDGSGHWDVYETPRPQNQPQTRVVKPSSNMPTKTFQTDLTNTETKKNTETTTLEPLTNQPIIEESINPVVVSIELPEVIPQKDRAACKAILSKVEEPEIRQEALFALAYALTACQVRSTPAYLVELVRAAKEKRLTKPPVTTPKPQTYWTRPEPTPVDNMAYYHDLWRKFGDSVLQYIPERYRPNTQTG